MFYKYMKKKKNRIKKEIRKNWELVVSMLLILPDFIRYLKGRRMYKPNVNHKSS